MKRLLECVVSIKSSACMVFTGTLLAFSLVYLCLGIGSVTLAVIFEMALLSLLGATVQWVFFSGRVVKNMAYGAALPVVPGGQPLGLGPVFAHLHPGLRGDHAGL